MINIYLCDDEDRIREQIQAEIEKKILIEAYDMCVAFSTNSPKELLEASCRAQQKQNIYFSVFIFQYVMDTAQTT